MRKWWKLFSWEFQMAVVWCASEKFNLFLARSRCRTTYTTHTTPKSRYFIILKKSLTLLFHSLDTESRLSAGKRDFIFKVTLSAMVKILRQFINSIIQESSRGIIKYLRDRNERWKSSQQLTSQSHWISTRIAAEYWSEQSLSLLVLCNARTLNSRALRRAALLLPLIFHPSFIPHWQSEDVRGGGEEERRKVENNEMLLHSFA